MAEKRFDISASVSGAQDVDRLREGFEDLQDTIRDVSGERLDVDTDELAKGLDDTKSKADEAAAAVVDLARKTDTELRDAAAAADALGQALGPELASKADLSTVVRGFQDMGLTLDEIKADADTLATALKQVDEINMGGLQGGIDTTTAKMGGLHDSSDQSRSVLANLAGNTAQDLGQLGGVVGSLGVGIGQLAEYAVDGNIKLSQLANVAGPMAALAGAGLLVSTAMAGIKADQAFKRELVDNFTDALREGATAAESLREQVEATGELQLSDDGLFGIGARLKDVIPTMNVLGVGLDDFQRLVDEALSGGTDSVNAFFDAMEESLGVTQREQSAVDDVRDAVFQYVDAINAAKSAQEQLDQFLGPDSMSDINFALQGARDQAEETDEMWRVLLNDMGPDGAVTMQTGVDAWNRLKVLLGNISDEEMTDIVNSKMPERIKEGGDNAAAAAESNREYRQSLADALAVVEETRAELQGIARDLDLAALRSDAVATAFDELNARSELTMSQEVIDFVGNLDTLHEALHEATRAGIDLNAVDLVPDSWDEITNMPEELGPVQAALVAFRTSVQSEMAQAFEQGGATGVREWAENTAAAVTENLHRAGVTSDEAVEQILSALGLLPPQVNMLIAVAGREQALATLALLQGAIDGLDPEVQIRIAAVAATDPVAALELAVAEFTRAGIEVPVELVALVDQLHADVAAEEQAPHETSIEATLDTVRAHTDMESFRLTKRGTTVEATASTLSAAAAMLDFETAPRSATIVAHAHTAGAGIDLDAVSTDRDTNITADALTANAESELNYAARDRYATIHVNTVGGASGGGSPFGAMGGPEGGAVGPLGAGPLGAGPRGAGEEAPTVAAAPAAAAPTVFVEPATEVHVTLNAGVIGSLFDVQRVVEAAVQDALRFKGQRRVLTVGGRNP